MTEPDREAAIDRLHAVALEEFVRERTRLARELRSGGDRATAAEIARWPKPSPAAWALNHVAREETDTIGEWIEAASALRDASARAEKGGDGLRGAMAEHRAATSRLVAMVRDRAQPAGRPLSDAMLDRVRALLQAATTDERLADELQLGRLTEDLDPSEPEPPKAEDGQSTRTAKAPRKAKPASTAPTKEDRAEAKRAERQAELEGRVATVSKEFERLSEEAGQHAATVKSADDRLDEARRAARRLESEAAAAREAANRADKAVRSVERELRGLRARL